ncbi:hypothetical protein BS47DRAFT_1332567 [Hydnum rufescens UP504]|uniref:Uncharacterized protein n=1 Tax=Hydnum rufescens UP504 TaxID=1448309 RepID=A0A9P6DRV2_9AGAM|nr:hypothetical protein BS47DRAFT_1332567 [Hydnum rufescens UP504]
MATDQENQSPEVPLLLPPLPAKSDGAPTLDINSNGSIKFDALGPLVVNSDGTLSRISNWTEMSEIERARVMRVLLARNQIRLANEEKKLDQNRAPITDTPPFG